MEPTTYLAGWLLLALGGVAVLSWFLARHRHRHDLRSAQAEAMLGALQRYSDWVAAQRLAAVFQGESPQAAAALDTACTIRLACFPELAGDMAELLAVHNRLVDFLAAQQQLWLRDPERWLQSDHDRRFMALWHLHGCALDALVRRLERLTSVQIRPSSTAPRRDTTYA